MMPARVPNPRVSFGMAACKLAMLAKIDGVSKADAEALVLRAQTQLPTDEHVASAVAGFAASVMAGDQRAAGAALHDFLISWSPDGMSGSWQDRKDCGHD